MEGIKKIFGKDEPLTAERAWVETTYGYGSYRPLEKRISDKIKEIDECIKNRFRYASQNNARASYYCIVSIEDDISCCVDEVFKPFIDNGFKVINLSKQVKEIDENNIYMISWKHVFIAKDDKKENKILNEDK